MNPFSLIFFTWVVQPPTRDPISTIAFFSDSTSFPGSLQDSRLITPTHAWMRRGTSLKGAICEAVNIHVALFLCQTIRFFLCVNFICTSPCTLRFWWSKTIFLVSWFQFQVFRSFIQTLVLTSSFTIFQVISSIYI